MPRIVREGQRLPDWCRLHRFEFVRVDAEGVSFAPEGRSERIVTVDGPVNLRQGARNLGLASGQFFDLDVEAGPVRLTAFYGAGLAVRLIGDWGPETAGCGVFRVVDEPEPSDRGDPVTYAKSTRMDSHYHDCDEYWIMVDGRAEVVVAGEAAGIGPGECLCIGMGRHHDMAAAPEPVRAVYFETAYERGRRMGHLWEHTHGPAVPAAGRD